MKNLNNGRPTVGVSLGNFSMLNLPSMINEDNALLAVTLYESNTLSSKDNGCGAFSPDRVTIPNLNWFDSMTRFSLEMSAKEQQLTVLLSFAALQGVSRIALKRKPVPKGSSMRVSMRRWKIVISLGGPSRLTAS